ncbi:MAG: cytochrome c oxidase subunit 3, partial [Alphaproteobacteria bacterium]|nr:cytochrome c oxidase subunit 3 [Alphaproteobacteria bacterium]
MATETTRQHPWHMVEPSPWPIVGTVAALAMALGGIWYMKGGAIWGFLVGVAILAATFWGWLRDVVREANSGTFHTEPVRHGLRMGMVMFIASEVMFFFAFFWAFFHASMPILSKVAQESWPPPGIEPLETWTLPFLNTLILLTSGVTVTYAHHAIRAGLRKEFIRGLAATMVLGFLFLGLQAYEYSHAAFGFTD